MAAENRLEWEETTKGDVQVGFGAAQFYLGSLESASWQLLYLHSSGGVGAKSGSGFCQIFFQFQLSSDPMRLR